MNATIDILDLGIPQKNSKHENLTPYKIAVAIFISEYIKLRQEAKKQSIYSIQSNAIGPDCRRDFCILVLKLIQNPDLEYNEMMCMIMDVQYQILPEHLNNFNEKLDLICDLGINVFMDLCDNIKSILCFNFNKLSVIGYFMRRFSISVESSSFVEITEILDKLKVFYSVSKRKKNNASDNICLELTDMMSGDSLESKTKSIKDSDISYHSRKQAELFIATQVALLEANEESALPPPVLQDRIRKLLKNNPEFAEAHFLSYLNCLRIKEFCGAIDSLYHCFDRNTLLGDKLSEDKNKSLRYAALNLAILHARFGHTEEALAALKEAICIAQEANDSVCLQHALMWMYKLTDDKKELLIERSILKCSDLGLSYNMSLGIQSITQYAGLHGGKPKFIFDIIAKSDVVNCQHSLIDLLSNSYSQKAGLWFLYGHLEMASLWSQLLVHLKTDHLIRGTISYNGEGLCQAVCNIAYLFVLHGEYEKSSAVLNHAKLRFPNEPLSRSWILTEQIRNFTQFYHNCSWQKAESSAQQMAVVDKLESDLSLTAIYIAKGDYDLANSVAEKVIKECEKDVKQIRARVRAMILIAEIKCAKFVESGFTAEVIILLNQALNFSKQYYLKYETAIINLHLANVQLWMEMPAHAMDLVNNSLAIIFAHGGCYDRARAMLLYIKCYISIKSNTGNAYDEILHCAKMLDTVAENFAKVESRSRLRDVYYLQSKLYAHCNMVTERNKYAAKFKALSEQYQSIGITATLVTSL